MTEAQSLARLLDVNKGFSSKTRKMTKTEYFDYAFTNMKDNTGNQSSEKDCRKEFLG
jgi:hypothetical protein